MYVGCEISIFSCEILANQTIHIGTKCIIIMNVVKKRYRFLPLKD